MLTLDAAFERLGIALREAGYTLAADERPPDAPRDRMAVYRSPEMAMRIRWTETARLLALQVESDGQWVDFRRFGFGPAGLEESAVDSLVRAVRNEVGETSTDAD
jgi:hypothetical protein